MYVSQCTQWHTCGRDPHINLQFQVLTQEVCMLMFAPAKSAARRASGGPRCISMAIPVMVPPFELLSLMSDRRIYMASRKPRRIRRWSPSRRPMLPRRRERTIQYLRLPQERHEASQERHEERAPSR